MSKLNKGQEKFLDQYTRKHLVSWAQHGLVHGEFPNLTGSMTLFLEHAVAKGWVSKDRLKVTSKGYLVATSFLK